MKPEPLPPPSQSAEAQWVEAELVRSLMRTQRPSQAVGWVLAAVLVGVLWNEAPMVLLAGWAILMAGAAAWRQAVLRRYARDVQAQGPEEHLAFFRRHRFAWPFSAFAWGLTTALYFDRASLGHQFICWLAMAGLAMFSINSLSTQRATMRAYLDTLTGTILAVLAWRMVFELQLQGPVDHWWLVALVLILWQVLRHAGERLHETHRRNFELQFRNNQLIESLTRQTQAALDAVEIKNRFLASAAHDIRQPVHALGLYADWLASEPELVQDLAPRIVESTKAVNRLFDSLFDLARLDSGKIRMTIEKINVQSLLHELELQYRPLCEAKGLEFRVHACAGTAMSDRILLQRIIGNLISNAVKYTQRGGILLASRPTPQGLRVEIWDTGAGIPPAYQREIFREFYKVPTHAGTEEGFGLGLYIVGRLTHILGHPLTFASRVGRGTVFRLQLLPTDPAAAADRAIASVARLSSDPT